MSKKIIKYGLLFVLFSAISGAIFYFNFEQKQKEIFAGNSGPEENATTETAFNAASLTWVEATSAAPWEMRDSFAAAVFDGKIWLMGGLNANENVLSPNVVEYWKAKYFSDIWYTEDGFNWTEATSTAPWGKRRSAEVVEFNGKLWLMGGWGPNIGLKNDVWSSADGVNWTLETSSAAWAPREGHQVVVFGGKMWLMGGVLYDDRKTLNDVWYSEDGINWTQVTSSAPWSGRWDHTVTVFNGKMWLMGGMDLNDHIFNEVWSSDDGQNWQLVTEHAPWQPRQGMGSCVYEDRLWVIGRFNDVINGGPNDVWYTVDGGNWEKTESDPVWLGREDIVALPFKGDIWIFGGMTSDWRWSNDVWYSTTTLQNQ